MTQPSGPWLPLDVVLAHLGQGSDPGDSIERARAAAAAFTERVRMDLFTQAGDPPARTFTPTPDVLEGAVLLAARLHARKASPAGLASFAEFGVAGVPNIDRDVERLLGIGRYAAPAVG